MCAWIIPKDMSHPYLSPIFARAIHSGDCQKMKEDGMNFA